METLYEVWIERSYKTVTEKVAVPVDPKDASKGQKIEEKPTKLDGTVFEPLLGDDDAPFQTANKAEAERRCTAPLNEDGVVRTYLRETRSLETYIAKESAE